MDHVDIDVRAGSILIFSDDGEMLTMDVEPGRESVVRVMSSRPPSLVTVHDGEDMALFAALERLGHDVSWKGITIDD
jgi:hypothetical protein